LPLSYLSWLLKIVMVAWQNICPKRIISVLQWKKTNSCVCTLILP
jgi:hypothetical protein